MRTGGPNLGDRLRGVALLFKHEAAGGIVLVAAAALALMLDNSRFAWTSEALLQTRLGVRLGDFALDKPLSALDQRRLDGGLLPSGRPRDQARAARR